MKRIEQIIGFALTSLAISVSASLFAHGESTAGPHDGYLRMPGAFHVEVTPQQNGYKVYLLDMNFQHPSNSNSTLIVSIKDNQTTTELTCKKKENYFFCAANASLLKQGTALTIQATRDNAKGALVTYPLPLSRDEN